MCLAHSGFFWSSERRAVRESPLQQMSRCGRLPLTPPEGERPMGRVLGELSGQPKRIEGCPFPQCQQVKADVSATR